jgi:hypothetical protein
MKYLQRNVYYSAALTHPDEGTILGKVINLLVKCTGTSNIPKQLICPSKV